MNARMNAAPSVRHKAVEDTVWFYLFAPDPPFHLPRVVREDFHEVEKKCYIIPYHLMYCFLFCSFVNINYPVWRAQKVPSKNCFLFL